MPSGLLYKAKKPIKKRCDSCDESYLEEETENIILNFKYFIVK